MRACMHACIHRWAMGACPNYMISWKSFGPGPQISEVPTAWSMAFMWKWDGGTIGLFWFVNLPLMQMQSETTVWGHGDGVMLSGAFNSIPSMNMNMNISQLIRMVCGWLFDNNALVLWVLATHILFFRLEMEVTTG